MQTENPFPVSSIASESDDPNSSRAGPLRPCSPERGDGDGTRRERDASASNFLGGRRKRSSRSLSGFGNLEF